MNKKSGDFTDADEAGGGEPWRTAAPESAGGYRMTALRQRLRQAGYSPIPVEGKRPAAKAWEQKHHSSDDEIALWSRVYEHAHNTGVLTRLTPCIDIDITSPEAAEAVEALAREHFEEHGQIMVRIGEAPKRAILLRTDQPFPKITGSVVASDSSEQKIELLCDGQQVVVFGIHPKTGKPYTWHGGQPDEVEHENLPYVRAEDAQRFIADAVALLVREHGYTAAATRPKSAKENGQGGGHADWGYLIANLRAGRELHESCDILAAKLITSGMNDGAAVNFLRGLFQETTAPKDQRWQERYDDIPRDVRTAREKFGQENAGRAQNAEHGAAERTHDHRPPLSPLPVVDMSNWDHEPVPEQEWTVLNRIPRRQVTLYSGEGGAGKSMKILHLCAAHSAGGREWLGTLPEPGPAIFFDAEDAKDVMHIRLAAVTRHYGISFADLIAGGLNLIALAGEDAVLGTVSRNGKIEPTPRYHQILEMAGDIKPVTIGIASAANVFAGNENDRSQVQQFVGLLTRIAIVANGSVTLIAHPSLTGINTGTGLSGSTQWHNAVRARIYERGVNPESGEQPDNDLREIEFKKNQYGPKAEKIVVRYTNGLFLPVPGTGALSTIERAAADAKAEQTFLALLDRLNGQDRNVSHKPNANNYAPTVFAAETEAKSAGIRKPTLEDVMRRLFQADKIHLESYGPPSRKNQRIVRGSKPTEEQTT